MRKFKYMITEELYGAIRSAIGSRPILEVEGIWNALKNPNHITLIPETAEQEKAKAPESEQKGAEA
jgi:hypothetical protein